MDSFEVYADPSPATTITASTFVQQVIYSAVAPPQKVLTTGTMLGGQANSDGEVQNFAQFDLRGPIAQGVCDTEATATACPIVSLSGGTAGPSPKDVCLGGNSSVFDPIYGAPHKNGVLGGGLSCINAGTSNIADEGLPAGYGEMYPVGQDCGFLDISNVQPGTYWFEGEINPVDHIVGHRAYAESDYSNNVSRVQVTIQSEATCPCQPGKSNSGNGC